MDALEVAKILQGQNLVATLVVVTIAAVPVTRGLFALISGRHQRRKEFLEFWKEIDLRKDDFWLEEIVQHRYGAPLSARVIRHVQLLERPSLKLRKVAMAAGYFDVDDTDQLVWVRPWRATFGWFAIEVLACCVGYFALASTGIGLLLLGLKQQLPDNVAFVAVGGAITTAACASFWHLISLTEARSTMALVSGVPAPGPWQWAKRHGVAAMATLQAKLSPSVGQSGKSP